MDFKFIPKECQGENPSFEGYIIFSVPSFKQRWAYIEQSGFTVNKDGAVENVMNSLSSLTRLVDLIKGHFKEVSLKYKDGSEFKSFSDMELDPICEPILFECAGEFLKGFRPSKN